MKVTKSPNELLALTNCAILNPADVTASQKFAKINGKLLSLRYLFCLGSICLFFCRIDNSVPVGYVGLSGIQRIWLQVSLNEDISFEFYQPKSSELNSSETFLFIEVNAFILLLHAYYFRLIF